MIWLFLWIACVQACTLYKPDVVHVHNVGYIFTYNNTFLKLTHNDVVHLSENDIPTIHVCDDRAVVQWNSKHVARREVEAPNAQEYTIPEKAASAILFMFEDVDTDQTINLFNTSNTNSVQNLVLESFNGRYTIDSITTTIVSNTMLSAFNSVSCTGVLSMLQTLVDNSDIPMPSGVSSADHYFFAFPFDSLTQCGVTGNVVLGASTTTLNSPYLWFRPQYNTQYETIQTLGTIVHEFMHQFGLNHIGCDANTNTTIERSDIFIAEYCDYLDANSNSEYAPPLSGVSKYTLSITTPEDIIYLRTSAPKTQSQQNVILRALECTGTTQTTTCGMDHPTTLVLSRSSKYITTFNQPETDSDVFNYLVNYESKYIVTVRSALVNGQDSVSAAAVNNKHESELIVHVQYAPHFFIKNSLFMSTNVLGVDGSVFDDPVSHLQVIRNNIVYDDNNNPTAINLTVYYTETEVQCDGKTRGSPCNIGSGNGVCDNFENTCKPYEIGPSFVDEYTDNGNGYLVFELVTNHSCNDKPVWAVQISGQDWYLFYYNTIKQSFRMSALQGDFTRHSCPTVSAEDAASFSLIEIPTILSQSFPETRMTQELYPFDNFYHHDLVSIWSVVDLSKRTDNLTIYHGAHIVLNGTITESTQLKFNCNISIITEITDYADIGSNLYVVSTDTIPNGDDCMLQNEANDILATFHVVGTSSSSTSITATSSTTTATTITTSSTTISTATITSTTTTNVETFITGAKITLTDNSKFADLFINQGAVIEWDNIGDQSHKFYAVNINTTARQFITQLIAPHSVLQSTIQLSPGKYEIYCSEHASHGVLGKLEVRIEPETPSSSSDDTTMWIIIGGVIGGIVLIAIVIWMLRRPKENRYSKLKSSMGDMKL